MTSSNGNIFRVTGPLCGDYTGHRWIPFTKASDAELWYFLSAEPEQTVEYTIKTLVIRDPIVPIMTSLLRINDAIFVNDVICNWQGNMVLEAGAISFELPLLRHVVSLNDDTCRSISPVVTERSARDPPLHTFNIGVFKSDKSKYITINHIYNTFVNLTRARLCYTQDYLTSVIVRCYIKNLCRFRWYPHNQWYHIFWRYIHIHSLVSWSLFPLPCHVLLLLMLILSSPLSSSSWYSVICPWMFP